MYVLGGNIAGSCGSASPRTNRASRPLSAVFQSLQPPSLWRNRKSSSPLTQVQTHTNSLLLLHFHLNQFMVLFCLKHDYTMCLKKTPCVQVSVGAEGSTISGSLQRRKKSKRKWKRLWFLLKDKVLYTFKAREVRGPRVSHTSTDTRLHAHKHSYSMHTCIPHNLDCFTS